MCYTGSSGHSYRRKLRLKYINICWILQHLDATEIISFLFFGARFAVVPRYKYCTCISVYCITVFLTGSISYHIIILSARCHHINKPVGTVRKKSVPQQTRLRFEVAVPFHGTN